MEALTAVAVGLLTVYDMLKAVDRGMTLDRPAPRGEARRPFRHLAAAARKEDLKLSFSKLLAALAVLVLAAGGYAWLQSRGGAGEQKLRVAKVERGALHAVVVASGTLNAVTTVQVGSQISGQVKDIYADFNTAVKKDQVIARIDPSTFELRVNQARADLDAAAQRGGGGALRAQSRSRPRSGRVKVTLADAQRDFERKKIAGRQELHLRRRARQGAQPCSTARASS